MTVVRVDLRQPAVRGRLREIKPPAASDPFRSRIVPHRPPVRLLLIVPLDDIAATDAEDLALKLLGSDPSPARSSPGGGVARPAGLAPSTGMGGRCRRRGRHPDVRFLDLRAEMLSFGHPRTGLTRLTGDDGHAGPRRSSGTWLRT
jgi:hypothetical protein